MAGKRLLDLVAMFHASRSVAKSHIALRAHQLDVYNKTSSVTQAIRDRSILATASISRSASRETRQQHGESTIPRPSTHQQHGESTIPRPSSHQQHGESTVPRPSTTKAQPQSREYKQPSVQQDHHYQPSEENTTADPVPQQELDLHQERAGESPLPAGTIPPVGSGTSRSALEQDVHAKSRVEDASSRPTPDMARRLQRHAEKQIPSATAQATSESDGGHWELNEGHDRDVYYAPSRQQSDVLSSLPRAKIPKQAEDSQGGDSHVDDGKITADVFYSATRHQDKMPSIPERAAVPEQEQAAEGVVTDIFHSPRIAKLLTGKDKKREAGALETKAAAKTPVEHSKLAEGKVQDTFNVRASAAPRHPSTATAKESEPHDGDIKALAEDISRDAKLDPHTTQATAEVAPPPYQLRESRVPSSRIGRLWQYGGLATSMAFGAATESLRRAAGSVDASQANGSLMLSAANMDRLVAKLSRMRGAALKLGQMMSFQDSRMLPPAIQQVLQRVQDSADFMPASQRNAVLASSLGPDWPSLFSSFTETPLAAASIGQVHAATLAATHEQVAVKIQYPGVASSISSDLSNLSLLLTASRLLPKGLYLDKTIANAREELAWECDYEREAACARRYGALLASDAAFTVPAIHAAASGPGVLTMTMLPGVAVSKLLPALSQSTRDWIGTQLLRLCLREITEFHYMQTDPNWTNFLYNAQTHKLELLDFGACRDYPETFIVPYARLLQAAARRDRPLARDLSVQLGYLTGMESKTMLDAHLTSLLTLAEPFAEGHAEETYDFRDQTITERVRGLVPVMLRERLGPPPEETYSLHRKLSGAFLLCARLGSRVQCRRLFEEAMGKAGLAE